MAGRTPLCTQVVTIERSKRSAYGLPIFVKAFLVTLLSLTLWQPSTSLTAIALEAAILIR